jgi:hypothetical protein
MPKTQKWFVPAVVLLLVFCAPRRVLSHDTGHHADLTRSAMAEFGFDDSAIKIGIVNNWLVDWYSNSVVNELKLKTHAANLHFDSRFKENMLLEDRDSLERYWNRLVANSQAIFKEAAQKEDKLLFLAALGASLHVVNDFYTHSNWVELHPPRCSNAYMTNTWYTTPFDAIPATIRTGRYPEDDDNPHLSHGDYGGGINHDCYCRCRWDQGYVFAFCASVEWISAVQNWTEAVKPGFWNSLKKMDAALTAKQNQDLERDLRAAFETSMWIDIPFAFHNGHWKGDGSGDFAMFAESLAWQKEPDSDFVKLVKDKNVKLFETLATGLYSGADPEDPPTGQKSSGIMKL